MSKRIFISDIHMGAQRAHGVGKFSYDWLSPQEGNILVSFLQYLHTNEPDLSELVIVGDFLDTWICPHDEEPPTFDQILAAHPHVVAAINALLAKGVRLVFVEGNHDMYLAKGDLDAVLHPSHNLEYYPDFYLNEGVYAVHGHVFDPFNKRVTSGPPNYPGYPLGYFISRIMATKKSLTDNSKKPIVEVIEHAITALIDNEPLAVAVFDAIREGAGLEENITFKMSGHGPPVTAAEVRNAFAGIPVSASIFDLKPFAKSLAKEHRAPNGFPDIGLVVCGHTHGALVEPLDLSDAADSDFDYTQVYANSGTWIGSAEDPVITPTYIEVEPDGSDSQLIHVRMMNWVNGAPEEKDTKFFVLPGGTVNFTSPAPPDDPSSDPYIE